MITETVRIIADWLADGTNGVNALLPSVPREGGITQAANVTVYDETRHPEVARGQVPDTTPCLIVTTLSTPVDQQSPNVAPFPADSSVSIGIRYATKASNTANATNDMAQFARAIPKSLRNLWLTTAGQTARVRNSVCLYEMRDYRIEFYQTNDDVTVLCGVMLTLKVRDTWVTG